MILTQLPTPPWVTIYLLTLLLTPRALCAFAPGSALTFSVYWGQNSAGNAGLAPQQRLSYYCANHSFDIINLAFLETIVTPSLNLYGQSDYCSTSATPAYYNTDLTLPSCAEIGEDITTCQNTYGKTILLSIGGATYSEGGFTTPSEAALAAQNIWAVFGPTAPSSTISNTSTTARPFGSAVINGFDLDIEGTAMNMAPFATELRSLMDAAAPCNTTTTSPNSTTSYPKRAVYPAAAAASQSTSKYYLTAAPQCPYPDLYTESLLLSPSVFLDAVNVQFYNNPCGLQSFVPGSSYGSPSTNTTAISGWQQQQQSQQTGQTAFNFAQWDLWARTVSLNPNVRVLLGVPGSSSAAGSGYVGTQVLGEIVGYTKQFNSFGGVMSWDASQAVANSGFETGVRGALGSSTTSTGGAGKLRRKGTGRYEGRAVFREGVRRKSLKGLGI